MTPKPGRYRLDPTRTTIRFRTRHMLGLGAVTGEFGLRGGRIDVAESVSDSTVRVAVDADSIDTGHAQRDRMVRSASYLDTRTYPDFDFVADEVRTADDHWIVEGTLNAHGVPVSLPITVHAVDAGAGEITFRASAQVDRYAHGITSGRGLAGRRLAIEIAAVATPE
jgi:polyisoprenoid-binding protein YceI